jgi:uncharacterized protein YkwD
MLAILTAILAATTTPIASNKVLLRAGQQCGGRGACIDAMTGQAYLCHNADNPWLDVACAANARCLNATSPGSGAYWFCVNMPSKAPASPKPAQKPATRPAPVPLPVPTPVPTPLPTPPSDPIPADMATLFRQHNEYRSRHGAPPMVWNASVARAAANWAMQCRNGHESQSNYGENLMSASSDPIDVSWLVGISTEQWYNEVRYYDCSRPGYQAGTGHFTQIVWKSSTALGCAAQRCSQTEGWVVCRYWPAGNYLGQFEWNVKC